MVMMKMENSNGGDSDESNDANGKNSDNETVVIMLMKIGRKVMVSTAMTVLLKKKWTVIVRKAMKVLMRRGWSVVFESENIYPISPLCTACEQLDAWKTGFIQRLEASTCIQDLNSQFDQFEECWRTNQDMQHLEMHMRRSRHIPI